MADQPIYDRLRTDAPMLGGRIYPRILPQHVVYPAAVYTRVSAPRTHLMSGPPLIEATLQVDVYGHRNDGAVAFQAVVDEVESALDRYKSATTTPPILASYIDNERDDYEDETQLYRKSYDLRTWYEG